ncbi:MAG: hypothetical protein A3D31_15350 [Candidatus Fluviicola riflensis]|nr:MAG: hypothetical protein CHH17_00285 [Candidatus Fluviicola riflensis]OGS78335.1 MAG: hypothetical protein A3D31_15350 [Candidatus Fluviicola riflensis]OGS85401.1 MAG: hypothetical protein A2724_12285 [Fluviicola sp. RIFCSPHIGHO2_01_FULL_43_53]OGS87443.1 MAG: hypothetical protein A3E30_08705 [Fluviicola sp. RIFCSPHIGHO2_12_FULL_43_24]
MKTGISPIFLLLLGIFLWSASVAQSNLSLAVRGKYLPLGGLEDAYGLTYTYGGEIILNDRHSIGVDGNMFRTRTEIDNDEDEAMYSEINRKTYGLVDYKLLMYVKPGIQIFLTAYQKWSGRYWMWYKKHKYDFGDQDLSFLQSTKRGRFNETGFGLGMKRYFSDSGFGLDLCLGMGYRTGTNEIYEHLSSYEARITPKLDYDHIRAYVRLNLFFQFPIRR